jgi:hypothetical protein
MSVPWKALGAALGIGAATFSESATVQCNARHGCHALIEPGQHAPEEKPEREQVAKLETAQGSTTRVKLAGTLHVMSSGRGALTAL